MQSGLVYRQLKGLGIFECGLWGWPTYRSHHIASPRPTSSPNPNNSTPPPSPTPHLPIFSFPSPSTSVDFGIRWEGKILEPRNAAVRPNFVPKRRFQTCICKIGDDPAFAKLA